jgi:hypothetical protein
MSIAKPTILAEKSLENLRVLRFGNRQTVRSVEMDRLSVIRRLLAGNAVMFTNRNPLGRKVG